LTASIIPHKTSNTIWSGPNIGMEKPMDAAVISRAPTSEVVLNSPRYYLTGATQ
jgi:hypothetical protein